MWNIRCLIHFLLALIFFGEKLVCVTWAVAAQHPGLDEGSWDTDVVEEAAVFTAGLQPWTSNQHLYSPLWSKKNNKKATIF